MIEFFEFQLRPRVLYKAGLVREMENEVGRLGAARALIVADAGVERSGLLDAVKGGLGGVEVAGIYSDVPANSSVRAVERGAAYAREVGADLIIAVGGGSPIDTAKCMRILISEGGSLLDYQGYNLLERPLIPMVAIPTTSGTGSEVTPFAVILDEDAHVKMTYASPFLAPDLAVLDPEMTRTLPPRLTAATGMDALTHAVETFVSSEANPLSDALALQAIDMISNHLRAATHTGEDMEARGQMLVASCIAGMAFASGFLGIVHAMAHSIGGAFEVHHGTANAILLPHGMRFNSTVVPNRYARIARALGVNAGGRPEDDVIADGIEAVIALSSDCGLPLRLRDVGVTEEALPAIAEIATTDAAIYTNPRHATDAEVLEILRAAW
ncbi:MAG TPA: iron-containing alcohol dehydrogenase [Roseiflexaceae bacterium]|nr:iron-containing alcohol dehydrogenase [Roseiflexaceae bacterium]